ncbi:3148_t:CDS:10 [Funneliformis mosseae]|uniref:3148_t:CDS:1 n=1 Tax=Funneliformis mosseae TaxID=27381 RepID=A0A9N8VI20_FUNMO|nr:3148_t:CDS:10 [Funneliformis mosseae]
MDMDPSATLLSLLHKNQNSPSETAMTGQRSPPTSSYPSQPTPPPIQSSPNPMQIFGITAPYPQPLAYNPTVFPQNTLTSISADSVTPQPQPGIISFGGDNEATTSSGTSDPTLLNIDKASTESLKLALFGRPSSTSFDESQQENENQYQADTSFPQDENPLEVDATYPEETADLEEKLPSETDVDYNKISTLESIGTTTSSSPSTKQSPSTTNKSMFTYTNPFDLLKISPPPSPSQSINTNQWNIQSTSSSQQKREAPVVQKESGVFSRHTEPFLSELSAWNIRANLSAQTISSVPDGVKLPRGILLYDTGKKNENILSRKDLELTTITLVPSELEYRAGKLIAVNGLYICYAVKGGKIRVISTLYGSKTLLRNHDKYILDMCIQDVLSDVFEDVIETQLLLAVGIDSKITVWELSEPPSEQESPRYHRAVWHPVIRNVFAVATDTNDVLVIDINKILEGEEERSFKESDISGKILKSKMLDKPINDLAFSPDGTILATASDDCVIFWALDFENDVGINPVKRIILDGQQVSSVLFIDGGQSSLFKFRYVILGTERNTILHLYDIESGVYIQSINFLPPPERRPPLSKSYRKEEAMFNCVSFDQETGTLFIANSARISIFALHLHFPQKKTEQFDSYNQALFGATSQNQIEYESMSSGDDPNSSNVVQFDYMIEFPVNQLIGSFVIVSDMNSSQGVSLYCIQSKAVQQYNISKYLILPPNFDACPEYVSAEFSLDQQQQEEDIKKDEQNKVSIVESFELSSNSESAQLSTADDANIDKDIVKEAAAIEIVNTRDECSSEITAFVTESEDIALIEKYAGQEPSTSNTIESTNNSDETESRSQESHKISSIKLSGPVVNGAIAKLKEKKKASQTTSSVQNNDLSSDSEKTSKRKESRQRDKDCGNENNYTPEATSKPTGKKVVDGISKNNGRIGGEKSRKPESQEVQPPIPSAGISPAQMQTILKEIRKMEDNVTNKLGRMFSKELEKQFQKIEEERVAHQAAETSRQETILKVVSQTLSTNTSKLLESTIRTEIQNSVLPNLGKMVTSAVDKQAHKGMVDAVNKNIPTAIDKAVSDNVPRVLSKAPVIESIAKGVSKSIRPVIEETFRENFTSVLIPSYQKATNAMFEQITTTFEAGLHDIAHKSAQSASFTNSQSTDHNVLARIQASIEHLTLAVQQLQMQANVNNANVGGNVRQVAGQQIEQHLEPPGLEENLNNVTDRFLELGNYEDAFVQVLASHDLPLIIRLCNKVNPKNVFHPSRPLLSQPVILSLIHHLSLELNKFSELKRAWIEDAVIKLNPKDHIIREHCERILPMVKQRLEEHYYQIATQDPQSPSLKNILLLIHAVNGLI